MITDALRLAAWRAMPGWMRGQLDADQVTRIVAAVLAEYKASEVIPQRPDAEGDW